MLQLGDKSSEPIQPLPLNLGELFESGNLARNLTVSLHTRLLDEADLLMMHLGSRTECSLSQTVLRAPLVPPFEAFELVIVILFPFCVSFADVLIEGEDLFVVLQRWGCPTSFCLALLGSLLRRRLADRQSICI